MLRMPKEKILFVVYKEIPKAIPMVGIFVSGSQKVLASKRRIAVSLCTLPQLEEGYNAKALK